MATGEIVTLVITIIFVLDMAVAFLVIFIERKRPAATLAWVSTILALPVIGIVLYCFFSQNIARKKIFKLTEGEDRAMTSSLRKQERSIKNGEFIFSNREADLWKDLILLNQNYGRSYLTQDNDIKIITDGKEMFSDLIEDIRNAEKSVNACYFILKPDEVGKKFIEELTKAAERGVEVRLLIDAMGSKKIWKRHTRNLRRAGGKVAEFFPTLLPIFKTINVRFNYRNHRKITVIDGKIGYIGGFNIAKEYLGLKEKFGYWRDTVIRVTGGAVQDMNMRFFMDWRYASKENVDLSDVFFTPPVTEGESAMQIVSSGPDSKHEKIKRAMMKMITSAAEEVLIQTPYFVPDGPMLESVKMAALSGVKVKIMIPCMPDHIFVYWATYSYAYDIIESGGEIHIYDNGFLHAKTIMVDGEVATIGSTNFDVRSFRLNFEGNAFIYDKDTVKKLRDTFEEDLKSCHQLTKELYDKRSLAIRIKEPVARLITDIL